MANDRILERERPEIVHEAGLFAHAPQRRSPQLVGGVLRPNLYDPVSSANVMQQKIAVGMDYLVSQSGGNYEHTAIDDGSGRSRGNGLNMANIATDVCEKSLASGGGGGRGKGRVSRRNHRAAYELGKVVDVLQAEIVRLVVDARRGQKDSRYLGRAQPAGDPHFVEVGIGDEGKQAAVLILPAEAPDTGLSRGLEDRSLHHFPIHSAFAQLWLRRGDRDQGAVVDGLHKPIAQRIQSGA